MTNFVERAIERAGLKPFLDARRANQPLPEVDWAAVDILVLGAIADATRSEEAGETVYVHPIRATRVTWVDAEGDLELLRRVAVARVTGPRQVRIGVDWSRTGLEVAQIALGFGASDLTGPITRKSGLPILDSESQKVKGQGQVALASLKRGEIARLIAHAGRLASFTDEAAPRTEGAAHV